MSCWLKSVCMLCLSGQVKVPRSCPARIVFASWSLCVLLLVATYTGNLVAFLSSIQVSPPFRSLEELANRDDYRVGTTGGTFWETKFKVGNIYYLIN